MSKKRHVLTATVYDRKGRILAIGQNSYSQTHPMQKHFAIKAGLDPKEFLHAEIAGIIRAMKRGKPYSISIERYHADGSPANAQPCPICMLAIKEAGIVKVEYTI